jgi:acetyl esterase/lipase
MKTTQSKTLYRLLKFFKVKKIMGSKEKNIFDNPKYNKPPRIISRKYEVTSEKIAGRNCYTLASDSNSDIHIVFLHGGAYRYPSTFFHWVLLDNLLKEIPCKATFVDYPLAPKYKCKHNVETVMEVYEHLFKSSCNDKIILLGDSAGGGLALVMAQLIKKKNILPKPKKVVMLSPWLDVSMDTDIPDDLQESDFLLERGLLGRSGVDYAGELDTKDPLCSPYYGDSKDVGEMALFMGTKDILHIDALRFKKKAEANNYDLTFFEYKDMMHDWVLFPIDDAKEALQEIVQFIKR